MLGTGKKAVSIASGDVHTCALLDDATIKCWGDGTYGVLGQEDNLPRGEKPGNMGDALPAIKLGIGKTPIAVAAGHTHSCALLGGGLVKCWGWGNTGALGTENTKTYGSEPSTMGDFLPVVKLGQGQLAKQIVTGENRTCALLTDGHVKCWGTGYLGFTGEKVGDQPGEMGDALPTIDLGNGLLATELSAGHHTVCARLDNGASKCWGINAHGQLGLGDTLARGKTSASMGDALPALDL